MTSEEKLLNLIRKKDTAAIQNKSERNKSKGFFYVRLAKIQWKRFSLHLGSYLSLIFILTAATLSGLLGYEIYKYQENQKKYLDYFVRDNAGAAEIAPVIQIPPIKPFSEYEQKLKERQLFTPSWERVNNVAQTQAVPQDDIRNYVKIIGIVVDKNPQVIIEDTRTNQTIIMAKGDFLGPVTLKEVLPDKVIFSTAQGDIEVLIP